MAGSKNRYPGGFDPKIRAEQEEFLRSIGQDLPDQNLPTRKYSDRLRVKVQYWKLPEEGRRKSRISNAARDIRNALLREKNVYGSYKDYVNYPEKRQLEIANDRVRGVIKNLKNYEETFLLSDTDIKELKKQLLPVKLQEVKTGVAPGDRMSIQHDIARKGITKRGIGGKRNVSGVTSWGNITDKKGKLLLIPHRTNASLGAVVSPSKLRNVGKLLSKIRSPVGALTLPAVGLASFFLPPEQAQAAMAVADPIGSSLFKGPSMTRNPNFTGLLGMEERRMVDPTWPMSTAINTPPKKKRESIWT